MKKITLVLLGIFIILTAYIKFLFWSSPHKISSESNSHVELALVGLVIVFILTTVFWKKKNL
jgi:uncharacterized membrane protein (DUF485 family)